MKMYRQFLSFLLVVAITYATIGSIFFMKVMPEIANLFGGVAIAGVISSMITVYWMLPIYIKEEDK